MLHANFQGVECWGTYRDNIKCVFTPSPHTNVKEMQEKSIFNGFLIKDLINL